MITDKKYSQLGLHDSEFPESTLTTEESLALFLSNSRKPDRMSVAEQMLRSIGKTPLYEQNKKD